MKTINSITIRKDDVISILILVFLWILFGFNTKTADSENYRFFYEALKDTNYVFGLEPGFALFMRVSNKLKLNYTQFLCLYSFIGLCFFWNYIKRYSRNTPIVVFLYGLFPYFFQIIQIRFFMSSMISLWSFHFLIEKKKKYIFNFVLFIFIATLFHVTAIFYLLMLLTLLPWNKIIKYEMIIMIICLLILILGISIVSHFIPKILIYVNGEKHTRFATKLFFLFFYFSLSYIIISLKKHKREYNRKFDDFACKSLVISIIYYVFIWFSMDFTRPLETVFINYYLLIINTYHFKQNIYSRKNELSVSFVYSILFLIGTIYILVFLFSAHQVFGIFNNNNFIPQLLGA
ncbi:MAG: EpsG family protein [Treponema sp.]|nr:EpsG family protein [Treponema sp.]